MKKNYALIISYDGTRLGGFQKQGNTDNTIQKMLEDTFSNITGENIEVIASGRTDAGTHAYGQVINFKTSSNLPKNDILKLANESLPNSIVCKEINEVDLRFHSRYNAASKKYLYKITNAPVNNPFMRKYAYFYDGHIDIQKMIAASNFLIGEHDFSAFSSNKKMKKSSVRVIYSIKIEKVHEEVTIEIEANGFLYNMARIITGTLLEVGTGKFAVSQIEKILASKKRSEAGITLPPHGLYLLEVKYNEKEGM